MSKSVTCVEQFGNDTVHGAIETSNVTEYDVEKSENGDDEGHLIDYNVAYLGIDVPNSVSTDVVDCIV